MKNLKDTFLGFRKKFKVRVKHYYTNRYTVEYANYYFIPVYRPLYFFFAQTLTSDTEGWTTQLFDYQSAEKVAKTLKSIEDVIKYHKKDEEREKEFYKQKKEYYAKHKPYDTKYF